MHDALPGRPTMLASLALLLAACSRPSPTTESGSAGPAKTTGPAATAAAATVTATAVPTPTTAKAAPPVAPGGRGPDGLPAEIPTARSKVPTLPEWDAASEITVPRSTPLGCETKMVREWLRVSCKRISHTGGKPGNVTKLEGCGAETLLFSKMETTTSLVSPVLRGKSCEVRFTWTNDRAAWLSIDWAAGAPRPVIAFRE